MTVQLRKSAQSAKRWLTLTMTAGLLATATGAQAAEGTQLRIVGSSTVFPFASYVAEELGATTNYPTPVIESTGSGGGLQLFCAGTGADTPDITNASRRIKVAEFKRCQKNGVKHITEVKIGSDGIVFAQNKSNEHWNLTREQIALALAAKVPVNGKLVDNPYTNWNQIDSSLPDREILVYGPPTSSGTRDAFEELVMEYGTEHIKGYDEAFTDIRRDGVYVPGGENDNLLVQRLAKNPKAFAIFGYAFLAENRGLIEAASIDGVKPKRELISSGEYPVARSLFFYTKNSHIDQVKSMDAYVDLFLADRMTGQRGFLTMLGLIPLPEKQRTAVKKRWDERADLSLSDLK